MAHETGLHRAYRRTRTFPRVVARARVRSTGHESQPGGGGDPAASRGPGDRTASSAPARRRSARSTRR